ncbi:GerMN domain-containing protein [Alloiococcus sp. CFN-8]|uniref:GerMN domain-containing protein n=1 Tax=Alloiococcus sp. CFN-8 TaxID=3416081 RepID=UPI003CEF1F85
MKNTNNKRKSGSFTLITAVAVLLLSLLVACASPEAPSTPGSDNSGNPPVSDGEQKEEPQSNPPVSEDEEEVEQREETHKSEKVTLYFSDAEVNYMLKETRVISYDNDKTLEDAIVEALIEGPKAEGRTRAILSTVKLIGTRVEDGICYVELSKEFFNENAAGTAGGGMALGTLVSSLLERDNIEGVVLIDQGEAITEYGGHFSFDGPITSPMGTVNEDGLEDSALTD